MEVISESGVEDCTGGWRGLAGRRRPPYRTSPDSVVASSVQNWSNAHRYVQAFWALVRTHFSFSMDSNGSSGIGCFTTFPFTKGCRRYPGMPRIGDRLSLTYSAAQSIMAKTSIAALSAPEPKNRRE